MRLEIREISKNFGPLKANDHISFTFEGGHIYAILGENGAGKSTLMKILSGYQAASSGQIVIDGKPVQINSPHHAIAHGIGMLYQDPLDFAPLTVLENYIEGKPFSFFMHRRDAEADLMARCKVLGFSLNPNAMVESLTVGERQQLEIVRLLSLGVGILILDEPTTGISAEQKSQLFQTLKNLAQEQNMTVILVSHKLADVEELCDEVLVLRRGKLVGHRLLPCETEIMVQMMFGKRLSQTSSQPLYTEKPVLKIHKLTVPARLFTIQNINLQVREGEVIGLAGLDGSGQVQFMRAIAGLGRPTWADQLTAIFALVGLWWVFGKVLDESSAVLNLAHIAILILVLGPLLKSLYPFIRQRSKQAEATEIILHGQSIGWRGYRDLLGRGVAYLAAGRLEEGLVAGLTLVDHAALANRSSLPYVNWLQAWRRTKGAITNFAIKGRPFSQIQTLSGGNQQRVSLSLLPDNLSLILLENPTRGLDVESAGHIWSLLLKRREQGTAIIFSSPDLDEVIDYSDRILVFSSGQTTLVENPEQMTTARLGELIGGKS
ncbi:MAG: ATP-binding cassette domain-containing protein [Chloroflexi bacterium]|nr:ATP-binding cassette domain-containing protein [Chloroflexota bacterium]